MKNVKKIIECFGGFQYLLAGGVIEVESDGFMPMRIMLAPRPGPRGLPVLKVAHVGSENGPGGGGRLLRDPEIDFEIDTTGKKWVWFPVSHENDFTGLYLLCCWKNRAGQVLAREVMAKDIMDFAKMWDGNIKVMGFLDAAFAQCGKKILKLHPKT